MCNCNHSPIKKQNGEYQLASTEIRLENSVIKSYTPPPHHQHFKTNCVYIEFFSSGHTYTLDIYLRIFSI